MAKSAMITLASLSLFVADALDHEKPVRPSCRLLVDHAEQYNDLTLSLLCRRSLGVSSQCSDLIFALGPRPWTEAKRDVACEHFEGQLLHERILFSVNETLDFGNLGAEVASEAEQFQNDESQALGIADSMIDQAVAQADQAAAKVAALAGAETMHGAAKARKALGEALPDIHAQAEITKHALRQDLLSSVGMLSSPFKDNFTKSLSAEVEQRIDQFQTVLTKHMAQYQIELNQSRVSGASQGFLGGPLGEGAKNPSGSVKDAAPSTTEGCHCQGCCPINNRIHQGVSGIDSITSQMEPATAPSTTEAAALEGAINAMSQNLDAFELLSNISSLKAQGQDLSRAADKAKDALELLSNISITEDAQNTLKGLHGNSGEHFGNKYEKDTAIRISRGPSTSLAGLVMMAAATVSIGVIAHRVCFRSSPCKAACILAHADEEAGAE